MRTLAYVADPLCSWCYGFRPTLERIEARVRVRYVMGGLAPDADQAMDPATRAYVQRAWDAVEARTGQPFDRRLWTEASPRRSTWPACRAVLAAGERGPELFRRLQEAFYTEARDATDPRVVLDLAAELGLDLDLDAPAAREALASDLRQRDAWGVTGFPALVGDGEVLMAGWEPAETLLSRLAAAGWLP
ncbi:MAG: DsbA family protein [Planctomycetota bacterium]|nr:DsbA family protein [Planctomycetota bacterium]